MLELHNKNFQVISKFGTVVVAALVSTFDDIKQKGLILWAATNPDRNTMMIVSSPIFCCIEQTHHYQLYTSTMLSTRSLHQDKRNCKTRHKSHLSDFGAMSHHRHRYHLPRSHEFDDSIIDFHDYHSLIIYAVRHV